MRIPTIYSIGGVLVLSLFFFAFNNAPGYVDDANPGPRWGHVFIYDPVNEQVLLFGGAKERRVFLDDTWVWENDQWTKMDIKGPEARGFCAVSFHGQRNTILLHGGRGNDGVTYSDLWEWDGRQWKQLEMESDFKADHHQMVYLDAENAILAFGGWNGENVSGNTWLWKNGWEKVAQTSPPKRASFGMTLDKGKQKVHLYGGLWINGQYADIWEWALGKWTPASGPYDNSSLDHHTLIFDEKRNKVVGFGGKNYRYRMQQTIFTLEEGKVVPITNEGPSGRHSIGFTYDNKNGVGYLFGGKEYQEGEQVGLDDFWRWDGEQWEEIK
ncbi:MAG: hypothetical protein DWQ02_05805 [Bacteroidetes bacterium]|nr:MAG: hypothetical protein DWQ02_05805 [Bacteroidota bacterium]